MKQIIPFILLVIFLFFMISAVGHAVGPFRSEIKITSDWHSETGKGGERRNNIHKGVDIVPLSMDYIIYPLMPGVVVEIGNHPIYGKYVIVDHENGLYSKYAHGEKIFYSAEVGCTVDYKTPLMEMGATGYTDGKHLHNEVYKIADKGKIYFNPLDFYRRRDAKNECKHGHEYTEENTYINAN